MQVEVDGKTVFSNQALIHMKDVKVLYQTSILLLNIVFFLTIGILVYIYFRFKYIKPIMFKYSLITFGIILSICAIMGIWILLDWEKAFEFFHKVIFPDPIKFRDAFFGWKSYYEELPHINNVVLVTVLSTSTFMDAAIIIISGTLVTYILYLVLTILIKKEIIFKPKEKQPN